MRNHSDPLIGNHGSEGPVTFDELLHAHLKGTPGRTDADRLADISREARNAFAALGHVKKAVSLFGSAREEPVDRWGRLTRETSGALTRAGFAVITGGGPGIMAAASQAALAGQGSSIGLTIDLPRDEVPNPHLTLRVPFHYFFLRKLAFVKYSCAFVCLPGGFGTLDEIFEALNLKLTHKVEPFPVILVGGDYWRGLRRWLEDVVVAAGALSPDDLDTLEILDDPDAVVARVKECHEGLCRRLGIHV